MSSTTAKRLIPVFAALGLTVLVVAGLSKVGCVNVHTPAGHVGYVRSKPLFGSGEFVGTQVGPTSTGWVWRQHVVNIDVRRRTYSEDMTVITAKGSELRFRAHARIAVNQAKVKDVVERYGGPDWYASNVQRQFQNEVRQAVAPLDPFEAKNRSFEIAATVKAALNDRYKDSPFEFESVDIGDIQYPPTIVTSVIRKFVTFQENERRDIERRIAEAQIAIGSAEARGIADAQETIRTTLDPMFLQYEALGALEALAGSPNTTFVVTPYSKNGGGTPMIMNLGGAQ